jgi:oligopeptide/dipeptide ABC transporter ATP-binding protein
LLRAIPLPDPTRRSDTGVDLKGEIPSPTNPPPGCRFHTRCPMVRADRCTTDEPALTATDTGLAACHWWRELVGR